MRTEKPFRVGTVVLLLGMIGLSLRLLPAEGFLFAGLSPRTDMEAVKRRYPHSSIVGGHVYVSEADSHDHIYGIDLAPAGSRQIRIFFERRGREAQYPACEQVSAAIKKQYGDPTTVQEANEEASRNRRLIWRGGEGDLTLLCFRMGRQPFLAAEVTITTGK